MQNTNESTGAAVVELPRATEIATGLTLFQIEESIALLAESAEEAGLTPEIEQALVTYLEGALEKRDRVVFEKARAKGIPVAVTLAGGYARRLEDTVQIHSNTIRVAREFAS